MALVVIAGWLAAAVLALGVGRALAVAIGADRPSFDAGMLSTILGIVVGLPAALAVSVALQRLEAHSAETARTQRRGELLQAVRDDLAETLAELVATGPEYRQPRESAVAPFLGSGLWRTLQASGDVSLIGPGALLYAVSRAYDRIAVTAYLERQLWEASFADTARVRTVPPTPTPAQELLGRVASQDRHTKAAIDVALERIADELGGT